MTDLPPDSSGFHEAMDCNRPPSPLEHTNTTGRRGTRGPAEAVDHGADEALYESAARYALSWSFLTDRQAAIEVWSPRPILGGAGVFIFTTYATLPTLTTVGARDGLH